MPEWLSHKCNNLFTEKKIKSLISPSLEILLVLRKEGFDNSCIQTYRLLHCNPLPSHHNPSIPHQKKLESGWEHCTSPPADCPHEDTGAPQPRATRQPHCCSPGPLAARPCGDTIHSRSSVNQLNSLFKSYSASIFFLPRHKYFKTQNKSGSQLKLTSPNIYWTKMTPLDSYSSYHSLQ